MLAIARYALKSPFHAVTMVGVLAILSLFIPLVSILSGALVGLIILTQGLFSGTRVILISLVGITLVSYLITRSPMLGITIGLVQWLPMMILAELLRRSRSLSFTLIVGMVLSLLAVVIQYTLWPDIEAFWMQLLMQMMGDAQQPGLEMTQIEPALQNMVHWMTLMLVAVMYGTFIATLLAARWFQAKLAGSDGYREEFYGIRLGKSVAASALAVSVAGLLIQQDWLKAMAFVVLTAFLYQGLAIVHNWSKSRNKSGWLFLLYVLMVIFPQIVGLTALLGMIDNWLDFRKRLKSLPTKTD